ncbi:MAG TPA: aconitate hydratase [Acidimicrobiales bacterium]|nr:aconitate hydratase [Acidimicrobiales bacterium]
MADSFGARADLGVGDRTYSIHRLDVLGDRVGHLPFSLRVLLENLLRNEDGSSVTAEHIDTLASWDPTAEPSDEIAFAPARVLMQDFTGVPCVVDLAAMRDAVADLGGDISKVNPLVPSELVIDHSIIADHFGTNDALRLNADLEYHRNLERYRFLKWGQGAFRNFTVVPPSTGICHQVNLEYLARVVFADDEGNAYPDTVVGTDSHTTMINGLGVLGWGVGGIEAEAAMLGQPISMLTPRVVGFKLSGSLPEGATATDLVLTVTQLLRKHGVVGKFVEFYGAGVGALPLENRATIGNMSPEYGSTCAIFPIDDETLRYLRFTGRPEEQVALVEAYAKEQRLWHDPSHEPVYSEYLELDLGTVEPSIAGPARPQDLIPLRLSKEVFCTSLVSSMPEPAMVPGSVDEASAESFPASDPPAAGGQDQEDTSTPPIDAHREVLGRPSHRCPVRLDDGQGFDLDHGHVVIAAITSCTNTSNPSVMVAAGLLAKKAVELGLETKPWVKTTLAPGSKVVVDYYDKAGLTAYLDKLRFNIVGFGCTTCIGNSGPLLPEISRAVNDNNLSVASVLSGNRNFEGRINPDVRMNYLASPPLVVAYALAGTMDWDPYTEPFPGSTVMLRDIWPSEAEVAATIRDAVQAEMFANRYGAVLEGDEHWRAVDVPGGDRFDWDDRSTYVRKPPYFDGMPAEPAPRADIRGARVLALLGDSITTDHISPAGNIRKDGPAGRYLVDGGVEPGDFNSYGARRGNHEVMIRGTFANIRLRNRLAPGTEGGVTMHLPAGSGDRPEQMSIYDASMRYQRDGVPLVVLAGKEYGSGSSRDWAAKGAALLGIKAVLAESFERIHRSNLIGMGVLPLELPASVEDLGLTGQETFDILGIAGTDPIPRRITVTADGRPIEVTVRIDTPKEQAYYLHGGILQYVLRQMVA